MNCACFGLKDEQLILCFQNEPWNFWFLFIHLIYARKAFQLFVIFKINIAHR
jgi:hypothetical protein